ncbi:MULTISPECIES: hypothetical protein [Pseudomonas]|uniref:hypothetical protein n=1 Tax=Pseudomonas TaxID=286 RepID=UPI001BE9DC26|nr:MULTISPECIES: hypothetical protein [Pseudomonas]MBT2342048.1 hypothetical protein [Pseudomonas fluorescens]MCD4531952.1 hypothetical protein [Pseudomonas sp. C3-2018]
MTSIDTWPLWIALIVSGGWLLLGIIGLIFNLYLNHRHMDAMMEALKNSRYIYIWGPAWRKRGWFGALSLTSKIAGMVLWPKASIHIGEADADDIANFPPYLKRLLVIDMTVMIIALTWMIIAVVLIKSR